MAKALDIGEWQGKVRIVLTGDEGQVIRATLQPEAVAGMMLALGQTLERLAASKSTTETDLFSLPPLIDTSDVRVHVARASSGAVVAALKPPGLPPCRFHLAPDEAEHFAEALTATARGPVPHGPKPN